VQCWQQRRDTARALRDACVQGGSVRSRDKELSREQKKLEQLRKEKEQLRHKESLMRTTLNISSGSSTGPHFSARMRQ
jgi:hypothetical protein